MKPFTVIVLYPERLQSSGCPVVYVAWVQAQDAFAARSVGSRQAHQKQRSADRGTLAEWPALVVFSEHCNTECFGWQP